MDLNSVDCNVVCGVVTPAVRDQGLAAGSASRSANAAPPMTAARVLAIATPSLALPALDWAGVPVPVTITAPAVKRARGTGNMPRRAQIVRTELREFYNESTKHHPGKHTRSARLHAAAHSKHVSALTATILAL